MFQTKVVWFGGRRYFIWPWGGVIKVKSRPYRIFL